MTILSALFLNQLVINSIPLMEIQADNLLSISFDANRLTHNFITISEALKGIQKQLAEMNSKQDGFDQCVQSHGLRIGQFDRKIREQGQLIAAHSKVLEQFQMNFQSEPSLPENQQKGQSSSNVGLEVKRKSQMSQKVLSEKENVGQQKKKVISISQDSKPKTSKFGVQKFMVNFKQRLAFLEEENAKKQASLADIEGYMERLKSKDGSMSFKKKSLNGGRLGTSSSRLGLVGQNKPRHSLQVQQADMHQQVSAFSIPSSGKESQMTIPLDFSSKDDMGKEIMYLRDCLVDKIKAIEAQFKDSQHRTQAMEKSVDMLERSHEMLKYDFQRTSSSYSKIRTANTKDQTRGSSRFANTKEQTLGQKKDELQNEIDLIRKENSHLQYKVSASRDQNGGVTSPSLHVPNEGKQKGKLVHSIRTEGSQNHKDINLIKRQLTKLRCEFEDFAFGVNCNPSETRTVVIKPNENKEDWKILSTKIYKLKMETQAGLREMEGKITANNDMVVVLNTLETGIEECRMLLKRKVETSDYDKGLKRVETKLNNFISQIYDKDNKMKETQASMAKQPWCCLSCGDQFKNYTAKMSKSPPKKELPGKKVNPENHMVRRNENGRLPSVLK